MAYAHMGEEQLSIVFDKKYQTMPDMTPAQFEALKQDIEERGLLTPIDIDEDGRILDGHHRYRALQELGIADFPTIVRPGLSEEDKRLYSRKTNMMRRHLSTKQVRELIRNQLLETPRWADNRIGQELGVDGKTVKTLREKMEATSEIPKFTELEGADGKVRKRRQAAVMSATEEERRRILEHLKSHGIEDAEGFLSSDGFIEMGTVDYFSDLRDEDQWSWTLFLLYLMQYGMPAEHAGSHIAWLRRHDFGNPTEWIGEEGARYRRSLARIARRESKETSQDIAEHLEQWKQYKEEHRGADIDSLIQSENARQQQD